MVVVGAAALAGAVIAASLLTGGEQRAASQGQGVSPAPAEIAGIPQQGIALGDPGAPRTLVYYGDVQCPYCALWDESDLPGIVEEYVWPGELRVVFRGLAFIGPESDLGLRAVLAAGLQDRGWNLLNVLYANQGHENAGWPTESSLPRFAAAIPGLDADRMLADLNAADVESELADARSAAEASLVPGTPFFELGPTGGELAPVQQQELESALAG